MDKSTPLRVAAAISAFVALPAAAAEPSTTPAAPQAQSYAEEPRARLIEAQYYPPPEYHHHHHHHWRRRWRHYYHHHHHHHHHSNY